MIANTSIWRVEHGMMPHRDFRKAPSSFIAPSIVICVCIVGM